MQARPPRLPALQNQAEVLGVHRAGGAARPEVIRQRITEATGQVFLQDEAPRQAGQEALEAPEPRNQSGRLVGEADEAVIGQEMVGAYPVEREAGHDDRRARDVGNQRPERGLRRLAVPRE